MTAVAALPTNRNLSPAAAHDRVQVIEVIADAYNAVMSDPAVRTSHDAAKYILAALEAAGAGFSFAPGPEAPMSDLRVRLRKAMAKSHAALTVVARLPHGAEFEAAHAELANWEDEIAAMEREIPNPPRRFEDLVARAEIARHGGDVVDGKLIEAEDEEDVFLGPAARLIDAVLQYRGSDPLGMSPTHAAYAKEWRALISTHMLQFGSFDEAMPITAAKAEERRMAEHMDLIDDLAAQIFTVPARTWGDVALYAQVAFWTHWSGIDPESAEAPGQLAAGPMGHGAAADKALAKLLLAIFTVAGVGPMGKPCGDRP